MNWIGRALFAAAAMTAGAAPARAAWQEATSRHFVVYSDDKPEAVARVADELERFDALIRYVQRRDEVPGAEDNKLTIYVVADIADLQRICGAGCANAAGVYFGRVSGSVAYTPKRAGFGGRLDLSPRIVLFHEYGHHFLLGNVLQAYPQWFSEGYAEFVSTATIGAKEAVLGRAALHRGYELLAETPIPIERVLDSVGKVRRDDMSALYARSWLLTHYLLTNSERLAKLNKYLALFNSGTSSLDAARQAFGDLGELNKTLDRYVRASGLAGFVVPLDRLPIVPATVRRLGPGEQALIELRAISDRGVDATLAASIYARARTAAAAFPDEPIAQGWLAEMAYDAGDLPAATQAADRALAKAPDSIQALRYKAKAETRRLVETRVADPKQWAEARRPLLHANHVAPNSAATMVTFYNSFAEQDVEPSRGAKQGIERALTLVPQDNGLRMRVAAQLLEENDVTTARLVLRPAAYDPHSQTASTAAAMLAQLDAGKSGPETIAALAKSAETAKAVKATPKTD